LLNNISSVPHPSFHISSITRAALFGVRHPSSVHTAYSLLLVVVGRACASTRNLHSQRATWPGVLPRPGLCPPALPSWGSGAVAFGGCGEYPGIHRRTDMQKDAAAYTVASTDTVHIGTSRYTWSYRGTHCIPYSHMGVGYAAIMPYHTIWSANGTNFTCRLAGHVTDSLTAFVLQIVGHMNKSTEIVLKLKTTTHDGSHWLQLKCNVSVGSFIVQCL
jgi:hypothetical protein